MESRNNILLIDNYDSFVFNLARYVEELGATPDVVRNNEIEIEEIAERNPAAIILSPGPCTPNEAGICNDIVKTCGATIPILGVCLGHQSIAVALGGKVIRAPEPVHGRTSIIEHTGTGLFKNCEQPLRVSRYHSLIVEEASLPKSLEVTARTCDGIIMALQHRKWSLFGVQFHPESILTHQGHQLLSNFLTLANIQVRTSLPCGDFPTSQPAEKDFYAKGISEDAFRPL